MSFIISKIQVFFYHIISLFSTKRNKYNTKKYKILKIYQFLTWIILIPIKFLEIFGFSFFLNYILRMFVKSRPLTKYEVEYLKTIFPESINYQLIRINENSKWAKLGAYHTQKKHLAFVWMNTINFTRPIDSQNNFCDLSWLIHEMVHITQFKSLGIQYIFEALLAQRFGGYYYGGKTNLTKHQLKDFNLEQQADIIKDYVLDLAKKKDVSIYKTYLNDLQQFKF